MAASGGVLAPIALRLLRSAATNATNTIRTKLSGGASKLQTVHVRNISSGGRHPIHPTAFLRQKRSGRWSSARVYQQVNSTVRRWISGSNGAGPRLDRTHPSSQTSCRVSQFTGRAPFASTLRPNLTGGALPRTQGGYSLGGGGAKGARYFSHTPAAPAHVVQNVGVAMRAFLLSGQKARFDGLNERGDKRYRAVTTCEADAAAKLARMSRFQPGSFVDFNLSPTVTALSPLAAAIPFPTGATAGVDVTLNRDGLMEVLSEDFGRALKDLAITYADLKRLAVLGDLPITTEKGGSTLRVRFPGVDAQTVERLCEDIGLQRGIVGQDADFDHAMGVSMALKFPLASEEDGGDTLTSPGGTLRSLTGLSIEDSEDGFLDDAFADVEMAENPWLSDPEGYESMSPEEVSSGSQDYDGLEGIYRFMEECDRARGRL